MDDSHFNQMVVKAVLLLSRARETMEFPGVATSPEYLAVIRLFVDELEWLIRWSSAVYDNSDGDRDRYHMHANDADGRVICERTTALLDEALRMLPRHVEWFMTHPETFRSIFPATILSLWLSEQLVRYEIEAVHGIPPPPADVLTPSGSGIWSKHDRMPFYLRVHPTTRRPLCHHLSVMPLPDVTQPLSGTTTIGENSSSNNAHRPAGICYRCLR
jgi:hypothetical protein